MTCEDFEHTNVVTKTAKRLAWFFVIFLNIYFVYFSVLRGITRSVSWQRDYVLACVFQLLVEVFLYETVECLWIHYTIPKLVAHEVAVTMNTVKHSVDMAFLKENEILHLDSPKHFFVSRQLADAYPHLFESSVVRAFHNHFPPGNLDLKMCATENRKGRKERKRVFPSTEWELEVNVSANELTKKESLFLSFVRRFNVSALIFLFLQTIGTVPIRLQQLVIHTIQPILFSFVIILFLIIEKHPVAALIPMAVVVYEALVYANKTHNQDKKPISAINDTEKINRIREMLKDKRREVLSMSDDVIDSPPDQLEDYDDNDDDVIEGFSAFVQSTNVNVHPQYSSMKRHGSNRRGFARQQTAEELIQEMADSDDDDFVPMSGSKGDSGSKFLRPGIRVGFNGFHRQQTAEELIREMADSDSEVDVPMELDNDNDSNSNIDDLPLGALDSNLIRLEGNVTKLEQELERMCLDTHFMTHDDFNSYVAATAFASSYRRTKGVVDLRSKWQRWWDDYRMLYSELILPYRNNRGYEISISEIRNARQLQERKSLKKIPIRVIHKMALLQLAEHERFTYTQQLLQRRGGHEALAKQSRDVMENLNAVSQPKPMWGDGRESLHRSMSWNPEANPNRKLNSPIKPWEHKKDGSDEIRVADAVHESEKKESEIMKKYLKLQSRTQSDVIS